jgi:raffinose/stachyose/melibiose transport system substrate-binding protein
MDQMNTRTCFSPEIDYHQTITYPHMHKRRNTSMKKTMFLMIISALLLSTAMAFAQGAAETPRSQPRSVTLDVMMSFPRFTEQMEDYFDQFEAKILAERGIQVTVNLEMPSSDQYNNILQTRLSSNDAPDLFTLHASADLPTYHKAGYVADLTNQPLAAKLYPDVRNTVSIDGKVLAVPFESTVWGYLYNKDIFTKLGLKAPDTLDEMRKVV